jgi:transposase-like protein
LLQKIDMQNEDKASSMYELVAQWHQSGKSQQQFSSEHDIKLATFSYWVKKHRQQKSSELGFAKVELGQHSTARIEIELADGTVIRLF